DLLCWQSDYAGGSLNVNGTIMRDTYNMVGGFFISVYPEGKSYPRDFSKCGFQEYPELPYAKVKISGVSEHQNINRIAYKELSRIDGGAVHMAKKTKIK
ncbi:hypothetical protein QQX80_25445, partial [Klebsiella quasipneumoniae]